MLCVLDESAATRMQTGSSWELFPQCLWGMEHLVPTRTFRRGLTLSTLGWVEGPVEVAPEFLVVLSVDQLEDALVHNICLEKKTAE